MSRLCIIPARGGSKRIPRKNIKLFLGKPIIAYSIQAALESGLFDEVMVSTDDVEIAEIAKEYGAVVPFLRSAQNAGDYASTLDVIEEVLAQYLEKGRDFSEVVCLYATAPFVTKKLLVEAFNLKAEKASDCVFPALAYSFPVQRSLMITAAGNLQLRYPEHQRSRSQDLEPVYHDAGMFYCFNPVTVRAKGKLWTDNSHLIILDEMNAHDIDTLVDWRVAELKFKLQHGIRL